jgi:histone acetyltransferase 1
MQLFILLYIEAGSYINEEEDSWEFVLLWVFLSRSYVPFLNVCVCADGNRYEKRKRRTTPVTETYHFIGYSSLYPFYCFPDKVRLRLRSVPLFLFVSKRAPNTLLSQFVIVPPFQHQGHGCQ